MQRAFSAFSEKPQRTSRYSIRQMQTISRRLQFHAALACALLHSVSALASAIDECDTLAAYPSDPDRKAPGRVFEQILLPEALNACKAAVEQEPESPRLIYQYGRVLLASGMQKEGEAWITRSAEKRYPQAIFTLGLFEVKKTPANMTRAAGRFLEAAALNHPRAMLILGDMHLDSVGVPSDAGEALTLYRRAAELGDVEALTAVGLVYADGLGVRQDYAEAARWFSKATDRDSWANYYLGKMYLQGVGFAQDVSQAYPFLHRSAEMGNEEAMGALGGCYLFGWGVTPDRNEAIRWLRKAAEKNNRDGIRYLGNALVGPERSAEDVREGLSLLTNAAEMGDPIAADNLASIYYYGHGVLVDKRKAAYWQNEAERMRSVDREKPRPLKMPPHRAVLPLG